MRFHWQNLNEKPGGRTGSDLRHGRAWWVVIERESAGNGRGVTVAWEWVLGKFSAGFHVGLVKHEERGLSFSFSLPLLLTLYVTVSGGPFAWLALKVLPEWTFEDGEDRRVELRIFDWAIWWDVWRDPMASWSRKTPKYRHGSWHVLDTLLGKSKYSSRPFHEGEIVVPMPERSYRGKVVISEDTWRRPRWFPRRIVRASVDMLPGEQVPFPGKGTTEYNCGEDALHGWSGPAGSVSEAVGHVVESVTRSRLRRGGEGWRPEAVRKKRA